MESQYAINVKRPKDNLNDLTKTYFSSSTTLSFVEYDVIVQEIFFFLLNPSLL